MKTTMILFGMLSVLSSCKCFKVADDIRRVWSLTFNQCRCQTYSLKEVRDLTPLIPCEDYFEPIRQDNEGDCKNPDYASKNPELCYVLPNDEYCDDLVGFSKYSWATNLTPKGRESKACMEDECGE